MNLIDLETLRDRVYQDAAECRDCYFEVPCVDGTFECAADPHECPVVQREILAAANVVKGNQ